MKHRSWLFAAVAMALVPCPVFAQAKFDGYLCCNMRSDGDWISDGNYAESGNRVLPAGTPVKVTGYGRHRVRVEIGGGKQALGNDYSRDLGLEAFARRYVVADDPSLKITTWPEQVQAAVKRSRVAAGMTREQVLVALGYPMSSENPDLDAPAWRYWLDSFTEFQVQFDAQGQVTGVIASPTVVNRVWEP